MRVLLVNAFHYLKGGVERTYLDESRWLMAAGHEVGHFAIEDPRNLTSPTAAHFAPAADFGEGTPASRQIRQIHRALWSKPAERQMTTLLRAFRPDIAHVHAPSRYLTPSIFRPLERARIPVVMTLHDFKPWCTNRLLFAHGAPCERCRGGAHWHAVAVGCVQGSRLKSLVGSVEAYLHDSRGAYRSVKRWIAPSQFVFDKARTLGVPAETLRVIRHGVEAPPATDAATGANRYVFFSGRLAFEKGVRALPTIADAIAGTRLLIAGDGPLREELAAAAASRPNMQLLGHLTDADLARHRAEASAVVVPSLFYEHFCYAAAEAMLDGRPVVAARIGAIPELVEHEVTGLLAEPRDDAGFARATRRVLEDPAARDWARNGRDRVRAESDPARHVAALEAVYAEVIAG